MLVLTRKRNQSIMIGDEVEIIIAGIQGDQVKLAISAPKTVAIYRKEVFEAIAAHTHEARATTAADVGALAGLLKK